MTFYQAVRTLKQRVLVMYRFVSLESKRTRVDLYNIVLNYLQLCVSYMEWF